MPESDIDLLAHLAAAFAERRAADAHIVALAAEVVDRSRPSLGAGGLASRHGDASATAMVARVGRVSLAEASRLCRLGAATASRLSLVGEVMPALFPVVALAVAQAHIPVDSALAIVSALSQASARADTSDLEAAEAALVDFARDNPADIVRRLAIAWRDALDADGVEPRDEMLVSKRSGKRVLLGNGLKRFVLDLDPASAAYLDAWIDGYVGSAIRTPRFEPASGASTSAAPDLSEPNSTEPNPADLDPADPRSLGQLTADAIVDLAKHGIGCSNVDAPRGATTVVVRMTLESLKTGLGIATIDGGLEPISAESARRMAADAGIIPIVLGGAGEVLDLGISRRLFSRAQRRAIVERDGGCAWPGCDRPPSYTEAHHIRWWSSGGRTDLRNAVLLCSRHHHLVHEHRWGIDVRDNVPWFIPPSSVDLYRVPRRGGRPRVPAPLRT